MCAENQEPAPSGAPGPAPPRKPRSERREQAAADVLRTFVRDLHEYRFGALPPTAGEVDLVLRLKVRPGEDWDLRFDPPLADQVGPQIEDARAGRDVFVDGRLYCFRCDSSGCEHSLPPSPLHVFAGYEPNGLPEWQELVQVLVAAKDEGVDRLFGKPPGTVSRVQFGHDLKERQLSSFGRASKTYAVLGQVVAGYFPCGGDERLAVTFQAVEGRGSGGEPQLRLNLLARTPDGTDLRDLLGSGWQPFVARARDLAAAALAAIEQRAAGARARGDAAAQREAMRDIPMILRRLAESLDRSGRQSARRTRHVEERRRQNRPVHKALDDALSAAPEAVYFDEKSGATLACGPQGRAHAFNPDGRHVTSFLISPAAVDFRLRTKRWRRLSADEADAFRERIREFGR